MQEIIIGYIGTPNLETVNGAKYPHRDYLLFSDREYTRMRMRSLLYTQKIERCVDRTHHIFGSKERGGNLYQNY